MIEGVNIQDNSGIVGSTVKSGMLGAAIGAGAGYVVQKKILGEKGDEFVAKVNENLNKREGKFLGETLKNLSTKFGTFVETVTTGNEGKIVKKSLGKASLYTAAVFAGVCLLGKGISSLFAKKED